LKIIYYHIVFILFPFFLYSCSQTQNIPRYTENIKDSMTVEEFKKTVISKSSGLISFEAEGSIDYENPKENNSGSILLSVTKPDSLYSKLSGPFGITGVIMSINRNNFVYYNVFEGFVIKGKTSSKNLSYIMRIEIGFDMLLSLISGSPDFLFDKKNSDYIRKIESKYHYVSYDSLKSETTKMVLDSLLNVERINILDKNNNEIINIEYSDYRLFDDFYFPFRIYFNRIQKKEQLWLNYSSVKKSEGYIKYKLKIPNSVKIINWE